MTLFPEHLDLELVFIDGVPASTRLLAVTGDLVLGEDGKKYPLRDLPSLIKQFWGQPRLDRAPGYFGEIRPETTINDGFGWDATPQGDGFWSALNDVVKIRLIGLEEYNAESQSGTAI